MGGELKGLAVWDGKVGDGPGGTASIVDFWDSRDIDRVVIPPPPPPPTPLPAQRQPSQLSVSPPALTAVSHKVVSILFADVVGFGHLNEEHVRFFAEYYLNELPKLVTRSTRKPRACNTWGDGLYMIFDEIRDAGLFALDLVDFVEETNWVKKGLPRDLHIRVALHTGPTYKFTEQLTHRDAYMGTHVFRSARIEPVTPPGNVYASGEFAALATTEGISEFVCEYCGRVPLAKEHGTYPLYHVRREHAMA